MLVVEKPNLQANSKIRFIRIILNIFFLIIIVRLWYLQIVNGSEFRQKSENNRLRRISIQAPRGILFDRNGMELVKNRASFDIEVVLEDCPNLEETLAKIAKLANITMPEIKSKFDKYQVKRKKFEPQLILSDVDRDTLARISAHRYELPGIIITIKPRREYIFGEAAAHILGYVREISSDQLKDIKLSSNYKSGDIIGQSGIEKLEDRLIQGVPGVQEITVNAIGTKIGEGTSDEEKPGGNITLTIDWKLQQILEEKLNGKVGAGIVMDPNTGEILAMSSKPSFDPNLFTKPISQEIYNKLFLESEKRMINRTFQDIYAPGSIFKFVVAIAGLMEGVITPKETINCNGAYRVGKGRPFHCHKRSGHGVVDLASAIKQSCNIYFYNLGQRLGVDRINQYATLFGFGQYSGIELEGDKTGLIPSTQWKKEQFRKPEDQIWYPGETPSVAIGQGAVSLTLVQIAKAVSALSNGGKLYKPQIIKTIRAYGDDAYLEERQPEVLANLNLDRTSVDLVIEALSAVVNEERGTGKSASLKEFGITVAGKTGTSQKASLDSTKGKIENAWFAGFAPAKKPSIVVVVLVESGGHGGEAAAPIAKEIFKAHFNVH